MKLVFMGSGAFAVPSLQALFDSPSHEVLALVTQPDKRAGRGHRLTPPATKFVAERYGLPVFQPRRIREPDAVSKVREWSPECIVVVAYGQIIPKSILDVPPKGIINVHASLLPSLRGAAPIQWAIARGHAETGVTTMLMNEGLDTGPILLQERFPIRVAETSETLAPKLSTMGATLLLRTLDQWAEGTLAPSPQDDALKTLAPIIKKEDGHIQWDTTAADIERRVRAFIPWPVVFVTFRDAPLKIWRAALQTPPAERADEAPGTIVLVSDDGVAVACADGSVLLLQDVQPAGKPRMSAASFARGRHLTAGSALR